jgi:hypothetical protein
MRTQHHHAVGGTDLTRWRIFLHIVAQQSQQVAHDDCYALVAHLDDEGARPNIVVDAACVWTVRASSPPETLAWWE